MAEDSDTNSISQVTITSLGTTNTSSTHTITYEVPESDSDSNDNEPISTTDPIPENPETLLKTPRLSNGDDDDISNSNLDPLNIKELALNFDYLIYKINDRLKYLSEIAQSSTLRFKQNVEITIMEVDKMIQKYYEILKLLNEVDTDFYKLEQLTLIIEDFVPRINELTDFFKKVIVL